MMKKNLVCLLPLVAMVVVACSSPEENGGTQVGADADPTVSSEQCFTLAAQQLQKTVDQVQTNDRFPFYVNAEGIWETESSAWWSSGFFAGCLWLMYDQSGDEKWHEYAIKWTEGMAPEQYNTSDGDSGYRMMSSYGHAYRITGNEEYREVLLQAAESYASLYNEQVGALKSFSADQWAFPVIVDHMMNLELLFWAAANGGDARWTEIAEQHALTTLRTHVRPDGSTIQLVNYDPDTGEVIGTDSLLGHDADSAWSRGQAEAFYGFAIAYKYTEDPRFLDAAGTLADFFIENLPEDQVPYWDFRAPGIPDTVKDASATAMAADGLLLLSALVIDDADGEKYHDAAVRMLASLCSSSYRARGDEGPGILLHGTWRQPDQPAVDTALIWGDYNVLSALLKYTRETGEL